jgi:hypothetical protein
LHCRRAAQAGGDHAAFGEQCRSCRLGVVMFNPPGSCRDECPASVRLGG